MLCAIWYNLYNLKNVKNTHGWGLLLVKLQAEASSYKSINSSSKLIRFFKLYKWYQTAQSLSFNNEVYEDQKTTWYNVRLLKQVGQLSTKNLRLLFVIFLKSKDLYFEFFIYFSKDKKVEIIQVKYSNFDFEKIEKLKTNYFFD